MEHSPRHTRILEVLEKVGTVGVRQLAHTLDVSTETIRRDLRVLSERGEVLRMHGAVGLPSVMHEAPFDRRMRENRPAKEAIARLAATTIQDGSSVMFDTGTTTSLLARALLDHRRLTVVTNSSDIARTLATVNGNRVYMAGGELRPDSGAALGHSAIEFINRFSVDHAIISAGAVNTDAGIGDYDLEEAQFGQAVLSRGRRRVVVTDATKFGRKGLVQVCSHDGFDEMIADSPPPEDIAQALLAGGVALRLVDGPEQV